MIFTLLALAVGPLIASSPAADSHLAGGFGIAANLAGATGRGATTGSAEAARARPAGTTARAAAARRQPSKGTASKSAGTGSASKSAGTGSASSTPTGTPKQIAWALLGQYGWSTSQFGCLDSLWTMESGWNPYATNPTSGAYGIPQSLPAYKMASAGADWRTNPLTQIRWGLSYIQSVYGTPCGAWAHETAYYWY